MLREADHQPLGMQRHVQRRLLDRQVLTYVGTPSGHDCTGAGTLATHVADNAGALGFQASVYYRTLDVPDLAESL
jgi:hypothetical protein